MASSVLDFTVANSKGVGVPMRELLGGRVALLVNTASACGFTPQYEGLQKLQDSLGPRGFTVVAFPCNQFGGQEPGTQEDIEKMVCTRALRRGNPAHAAAPARPWQPRARGSPAPLAGQPGARGSPAPLAATTPRANTICSPPPARVRPTGFKATFPIMKKIEVNGDGADPLWVHMKAAVSGKCEGPQNAPRQKNIAPRALTPAATTTPAPPPMNPTEARLPRLSGDQVELQQIPGGQGGPGG